MRYKIVLWPIMGETLAVVSTLYDHYERGTNYTVRYQLKTRGPDWDLQGFLRELADQIDAIPEP
jgi:hypothetical protein